MESATRKPKGGRIAMVLKEARASLKEPSRPHTPASLDARTAMSLDGAMSRADLYDAKRDKRGERERGPSGAKSKKNQQADIWVNENIDNSDDSNGDGYNQSSSSGKSKVRVNSTDFMYGLLAEDLRNSVGGEYGGRQESRRGSENLNGANSSQSIFNMNDTDAFAKGGDEGSALQLVMCDLKDALNNLDNSFGSYGAGGSVGGDSSSSPIYHILDGMSGPVERLSKHIKSGVRTPSGSQKALDNVLNHFKRSLIRVIAESRDQDRSMSQPHTEITRLGCCHLLRVYVSILARSATSTLTADVARVAMRASKALYQVDTAAASSSSGGRGISSAKQQQEDEGGSESGNGSESTRGSQGRAGSSRRGSRDRGSSARHAMDTVMLQGCPDLLLEMLSQTWTRLPSDLYRELHPAEGNAQDGPGQGQSAELDEYGLPAYLSNPLFLLLEAAVFSAGTLRSYSSSSVNARRLMHLGLVECMVSGMRVAVSCADVIDKVHKKSLNTVGTVDAAERDVTAELGLARQISTQLSRCMEQVTAALRAFTLDGQGRTKLLDQKAIALLCKLTVRRETHQASPGLLLNCVRGTSKLSLLEPFRAQLNSKRSSIEHLCALLSAEADAAADMSSSTESWPQWHTWPLLSRVCFTLGNLTTSNDANRKLIALSCDSVRPLVVLLRECGQSLQRLSRERRRRDMGKLLGDDAEVSTDAYHDEEDDEREASDDGAVCGSPDESPQKAAIDEPVLEYESGELMKDDMVQECRDDEDKTADKDEGLSAVEREARAKEQEIADAAVKILRLLANVAIEGKVGSLLASDSHALTVVVQLLGDHCNESATLSSDTGGSSTEELMLNIVAACTNISYYACIKASSFSHVDVGPSISGKEKVESSELDLSLSFDESGDLSALRKGESDADVSENGQQRQILRVLLKMTSHLSYALFHSNDEIVLEAARALGNLTRLPQVLYSLSSSRTDEALVLLLGHHHMEVVAAVAGTLVNLSAHAPNKHSLLLRTAAPSLLVKALRRSSMRHMTTSMLIVQVFHNLLSTSKFEGDEEKEGKVDNTQEQDKAAVSACGFPGLMDTLDELVDLASETTEGEDDKYARFAKVGSAVRDLLIQRDRKHGREWTKAESGAPAYYVEEEDGEED